MEVNAPNSQKLVAQEIIVKHKRGIVKCHMKMQFTVVATWLITPVFVHQPQSKSATPVSSIEHHECLTAKFKCFQVQPKARSLVTNVHFP